VEKRSQKFGFNFVIFKTLTKVTNCPMGGNSPNLVTLASILSLDRVTSLSKKKRWA
jgi:hypothetical protein